jgi:nucleoid-associated protein YgaU
MFGLILGELTGGAGLPVDRLPTELSEISPDDVLPIIEAPPENMIASTVSSASRDGTESPDSSPAAPSFVEHLVPGGAESESPVSPTSMQMSAQRLRCEKTTSLTGEQLVVTAQRPRTYIVQPNDSLRKIARKVYGPDKEEQFQRIFDANRHILDDESMILVNQELIIPTLDEHEAPQRFANHPNLTPHPRMLAATPPHTQIVREMDLQELREHFALPAVLPGKPTPHAERFYVVRPNDNLTKIAKRILRDDSHKAVMKIYNANRDKISDPDVLSVGTELRIPG